MPITLLLDGGAAHIPAGEGQTILDAVRAASAAPIHAPCGGQGMCRKCTVYLVTEAGETPVLACRTPAQDGMTIRLPSVAPLAVETAGRAAAADFPPDPGLSDWGIACDIGTTTVVCRLIDLSDGRLLASAGEANAQRPYGDDVISRIKASMDGLRPALTSAIVGQLSRMIASLCAAAGGDAGRVTRMAVAANTTMCHLLAGLPPDSIGSAPFTPMSRFGDEWDARAMGLPFDGPVYLVPAVSGYVGGDVTADLLAAGLDRAEKPVLLIDVGTNGEMALGCGDRFLCCSTAAGPAFEGAQIRCGMTAAPGAISAVELREGQLSCSVLGGGEAVGLCGSGLVDAVAVLLTLGAVDETGRMLHPEEDADELPDAVRPHLFLWEDEPAFRLTERVFVTQSDVRRLQLGKGAIAAGAGILLRESGLRWEDVGALLLSGGFGSYIRPESAARIGLIPAQLLPVTRAVGNTAVLGAQAALVSAGARARLARLQKNMAYRELSGMPEFTAAYMEAVLFPEEE